jgi:hypothetical protein
VRARKRRFAALLAAALALPGISAPDLAEAQQIPEAATVRLKYQDYRDYQGRDQERMRIHVPSFLISLPLFESTQVDVGGTLDSMSGASPLYHNTLTGASGKGVEDTRRAGDIKVTQYFNRFSVALGGVWSTEDDYLSRGGLTEARWWTEDKNTVLALGFEAYVDDLSSSSNPLVDESRRSRNALFGITQVISPTQILQSNVTFHYSEGYHSDPYKLADRRPTQRHLWAWLTRYNQFFDGSEGALHLSYRYAADTWSVQSHMIEASWYQPLGDAWMLRPRLRYYTQERADFYSSVFPPEDFEAQYTADQRLGDFGSITPGLKLEYAFAKDWSADIAVDYVMQRPEWKIGPANSNTIDSFEALVFAVGLVKRF